MRRHATGALQDSCVIVSTQRSICKWIIESASGISVSMDQPEAVYAACSTSDKVWGAPPSPLWGMDLAHDKIHATLPRWVDRPKH